MRCFIAYISSIFLYNSELWCYNKTLGSEIDAFHRRQLRYALGIYYPKKISSEYLYEITQAQPWSEVIKRRRLNWLGHLMRLPADTPARQALEEHLRQTKSKAGRPKTTWLKTIQNDLEPLGIKLNLKDKKNTIKTLEQITENRTDWRALVAAAM